MQGVTGAPLAGFAAREHRISVSQACARRDAPARRGGRVPPAPDLSGSSIGTGSRRNTFWSRGKCAFCTPDGFAERGPCALPASRLHLPGRPARFVGASLEKVPHVSPDPHPHPSARTCWDG
jgi:hypothetical protein